MPDDEAMKDIAASCAHAAAVKLATTAPDKLALAQLEAAARAVYDDPAVAPGVKKVAIKVTTFATRPGPGQWEGEPTEAAAVTARLDALIASIPEPEDFAAFQAAVARGPRR